MKTYTFYQLNLGNNFVAHLVVDNTTKVLIYASGPFKRGTNVWFPVGFGN